MAKSLRVVRPRYKQLVISIKTLLDISQLSIEEVTGRLKAADDVEPTPPQAAGGKLLLTEEQWLEKYKKQDSVRGGSSIGGWGKRHGKPRGCGGSNSSDARSSAGSGHAAGLDDMCKRCGKEGHWAKNCRGKLKVEEQAHVAQDEEHTLMFAYGAEEEYALSTSPLLPQAPLPHPKEAPPPHPMQTAGGDAASPHQRELLEANRTLPSLLNTADAADAAPTPCQLELLEAKVFATFDAADDRDPKRWVLDTGAMNHMTSSRGAFSELDTGIVGTVRFGNGSVVKIEGRDTILFACKNEEHHTLANTYFIPRLTTNVISVGQLNEVGFQVLVEGGVIIIRDEERRLLAKV
ncbi:uncharacterized protein [Miscanthus floridulus]|uniref:uncharacterized protein n=1 Tax=Miscanthus floridulus TaxID=154761 RepID=UPI00345828EC